VGQASCIDAQRSSGAATGFVSGTCAVDCLGDALPNRGCPEDTACVKSAVLAGACTRCAPRCNDVGARSTCRVGYLCAPQPEDDGGTGACEPDCRNPGAVCASPSGGCELDSGLCADGGHVFGCPFIF
jgi:hypothetical protein